MPSTPQSRARRWLHTVAREGARYISDLPVYDDEPYAYLEAAACHYDYEHRDDLYVEEYIAVDPVHRTATLAVRRVTDGDYDAGPYQGPTSPDDPAVGRSLTCRRGLPATITPIVCRSVAEARAILGQGRESVL